MAFENKEIFNSVASSALEKYGLEKTHETKLITFSENATYLVRNMKTGAKDGVLRVSRPGYHTLDEIQAEMKWLTQINEYTPLAVANALKGINGEIVQQVKDSNGKIYFCVMCEFLTGESPDENDETQLVEQFKYLGETIAYLHRQTEIWNGAQKLNRPVWDFNTIIGENAIWGDWRAFPGIGEKQEHLFSQVSKIIEVRLKRYTKTDSNFGLIHADLRLANILTEDGKIKVIDFDDCGFGYHLHDLAAALSFIEEKSFVPHLINSWLEGYKKVLPFTDNDFEEIDTFIMMRRLQFTAWLASHQESDPAKQYTPGWLDGTVYLAERYVRLFG